MRGAEETQKYAGALGENDSKPAQERQASLLHRVFLLKTQRSAI